MKQENNELVLNVKLNKLMLKNDININKFILDKINVENATTFYKLAKLYKISIVKLSLSYIDRCFTMVVKSQNFLELDYKTVTKILKSCKLSVQTELEVFRSANNWLKYNTKKRNKFAKKLLLTVRLPRLSDHALKYISNTASSFTENE